MLYHMFTLVATGLAFTPPKPCLQTQVVVHIGLSSSIPGINDVVYNEDSNNSGRGSSLKCNDTGPSVYCPNLEAALQYELSNRCLLLYKDEIVESSHNKSHVNTLVLTPATSPSNKTTKTLKIIFANDNSSLIFWNCHIVHILNINFIQSKGVRFPHRALSFHFASNLNMNNVRFDNFVGHALSIVAAQQAGDIILTDIVVASERSRDEVSKGVHIETVANASCAITITESHFKNLSDLRNMSVCSEADNNEHQLCGRGAALGVAFGNSPVDVKFTISNQSYFGDNSAFIGAGMYVKMPSTVNSGSLDIDISHASFKGNKAQFLGGGIIFTTPTLDGRDVEYSASSTINASHLEFFNNTADRGGAMAFWKIGKMVTTIILRNSIFKYSKASSCGADVYSVETSLSFIDIQTTNCECIEETQQKQGFGSIAIYGAVLTVKSVVISYHSGSGVVLDMSSLVINGLLSVANNTAYLGGGLALFQDSIITLTKETDLQLDYNRAELNGGGLYVSSSFPLTSQCFFQNHKNFTGTVRFMNNTSPSGDAVYAKSLRGCTGHFFVDELLFDVLTGWPQFEISCGGEVNCISTDPSRMEFHLDDTDTIRPGVAHHFHISMEDERGHADMVPLYIYISSLSNQVSFKNKSPWSVVSGNTLVFYGPKDVPFGLTVSASYHLTMKLVENLSLVDCAWYQNQSKSLSCICKPGKSLSNLGIQSCSNGNIYLARNKWISNTSKVYDCPLGYCSTIESENEYYPAHQCNPTRDQTSVLCSKCKANLSVVIGDNANCHNCTDHSKKNDWLVVICETLVVDLIIILAILLLNWDRYAGFLNSVIFSYRLIPSLLRKTKMIKDTYRVTILSIFDRVQNGKATMGVMCIADDFNNLQRMWVDFGMAMSWFITWSLVFLFYYQFRIISRDAYYRTASVLAMIVYFEFMEFLLRVLHPIDISDQVGDDGTWRVFEYATEEYGSTQHSLLLIAAGFVFLVIVYCLLVSFLEGLPSEQGTNKCVDCILPQELKPFFLYQRNCFKKSRESILVDRSWFLVLRYILFTVYLALAEYNFSVIRNICMSLVMLVLLWCLLAFLPYQNAAFNIFEMVLVANVLVIGVLTESISEFDFPAYTAWLVDLLCYVPMVGLILWSFHYIAMYFTVVSSCFNYARRMKIFGMKTREKSEYCIPLEIIFFCLCYVLRRIYLLKDHFYIKY